MNALKFGAVCLVLTLATVARAQQLTVGEWQQQVMTKGNAIRLAVAADSGDLKNGISTIINGNCGYSKNDKEYRSARLSRHYREVVQASASMNAEAMYEKALQFHNTRLASKMYTSCWNTIKGAANGAATAAAAVDEIVGYGAKPQAQSFGR